MARCSLYVRDEPLILSHNGVDMVLVPTAEIMALQFISREVLILKFPFTQIQKEMEHKPTCYPSIVVGVRL